MGARIILAGSSSTIRGLHWESTSALSIGRLRHLDVVLEDPSVAREHAEVYATPQGWMVRDLGSGAGTLLNGVPVSQVAKRLRADDVLQFGRLLIGVSTLEEEAPPIYAAPKTPANIKTTGPLVRVQALSQRSWEQGVQDMASDEPRLAQGKHFLTLVRGGYHLAHVHCLSDFLQLLLDDLVAVLDAQRGAFVLFDDASEQLQLRAASLAKGKLNARRCFSSTLAQRCYFKGESILCHDVAAEEALQSSKSALRGDMSSILCMLVRSPRRRLGILHLDRGPLQDPFTQEDFSLAEAVTASIAIGLESALLVDKQRQALEKEALSLARLALEQADAHLVPRVQRVAALARSLGEELRLTNAELHHLQLAAWLHDLKGAQPAPDAELAGAALVLRSLEERYDGAGLPDHLSGEDIPRPARVLAIVLALHALLHPALSEAPLSRAEALANLRKQTGARFDPECFAGLEKICTQAVTI